MNHSLIAGILTTLAFAAAPEPSTPRAGAPDSRSFGSPLCHRLECTETQKAAVAKIEQAQRAEAAEVKKELQAARAKLAAEFAKPKLDAATIDKLQAEINGFHADLANVRLDSLKDIHAVLTPDQRAKLAAKLAKGDHHRGGPKGGHKAWRGKGQGPDKDGRGQGRGRGPASVAG